MLFSNKNDNVVTSVQTNLVCSMIHIRTYFTWTGCNESVCLFPGSDIAMFIFTLSLYLGVRKSDV